jgi:hypothetical protein
MSSRSFRSQITAALCCAISLFAQPAPKPAARPFQNQSSSTINYTPGPDGSETVEIHNVSYEIIGTQVPGRPPSERLLLRKTTHSKQTPGDIGEDATITLEAWRLGDDIGQKPLYTITAGGTDGHTLDNALFVASRALEEVEWWSVYKLGSGQHFFDTYVPLISFSISRETLETRYVGLEVPPDDEADATLKKPNVVGALSYASEDRMIREVLLTCDDLQQAQLLRSYADVTRTVSFDDDSHSIKISFRQNYPSPPKPVDVLIRLVGDDLDLAHAQLPPRMHAISWRRGSDSRSVRK